MTHQIVQKLVSWLNDTALPYWSIDAFDAKVGLFYERMRPDGRPDLLADRRVRVQLRQVYVLSHAACAGWGANMTDTALRTWRELKLRCGPLGVAEGFPHLLHPNGAVKDERRDSYDHAFAVLAAAWLARASGEPSVRRDLDALLGFVDARLTDAAGLLLEGWPHAPPRRQNPLMHWFEAMINLHDALGHPDALRRAARCRSFMEDKLFDGATGTIGEFFDDSWEPSPGPIGQSVEPGHLAEWVWLLRAHERLAGLASGDVPDRLMATTLACADAASGLLVDEVDRTLRVRRGTRRSWLQTELCKALVAQAEIGRPGAADRAVAALADLDRHHLGAPFAAGWIDRLDADGAAVPGPVPTSILYHVFVAVLEADRVLSGRNPH